MTKRGTEGVHDSIGTPRRRWILQLGQDQLTPKACYYPLELEKYGLKTYYFSQDRSGLSAATIKKYNLDAEIVPRNLLAHWFRFLVLIRKLKPVHIEMYLSLRPWTLFIYTIVALVFRVPIVTWCRGEILNWERHHWLRRMANRYTLRRSKVILLRELYMESILEKHKVVDLSRTRLFPNSIPVGPEPQSERGPVVLFLNSFKPWRHPDLVVLAARTVVDSIPEARFELVGATASLPGYSPAPEALERQLQDQVDQLGLSHRVTILPFSDKTDEYFARAAVFVLPADIVFCNYSLIESMAAGIVPVIADVDGAARIVENGVSGYIVAQDAELMAEKIIHLLRNDTLRRQMAVAARAQIQRHYNAEVTAESLHDLFQKMVWPQT